jgi:hypothetical protein
MTAMRSQVHQSIESGLLAASELVPVGDHFCLHRYDLGLTALLNTEAAGEWRAFAGTATPQIALPASGFSTGFIDNLAATGFLDPPQSHRGPGNRDGRPLAPDLTPRFLVAAPGGCRIGIATDDNHVAKLLEATLIAASGACGAETDTVITVTAEPHGLTVWRDGVCIVAGCDPSMARRAVVQSAILAAAPFPATAAILHASTVALDGEGVVLAGTTGSGKTNLMLHAASAGATYLADDFTGLDDAGSRVSPFPLRASVKAPMWPHWRAVFPELASARTFEIAGRQVRYLSPTGRAGIAQAPVAPGLIVFPVYTPGAACEARPMAPEECFGRLLATGSEIVGLNRSVRPIARLAERVPTIELTYSDMAVAWSKIRTAMAGLA